MAAPIVGAIAVLLLLLWAGKVLLSSLHIGNAVQRTAVILTGENRGSVSVSLNGKEPRVADSELKLYPGDTVITDRGSPASLELFDGSDIRLDRGSSLTVEESVLGEVESAFAVSLDRGMLWIRTPAAIAFSGTVLRTIKTSRYEADIPSGAEAYFSADGIEVYASDGVGVTFRIPKIRSNLIVGEGQRFTVPAADTEIADPYVNRSALATDFVASAFVRESRELHTGVPVGPVGETPDTSEAIITITEPTEGEEILSATITVSGTISAAVDAVRVNGYRAFADLAKRTYAIEIAVPDVEEVAITVEALGKDGLVVGKVLRTVNRDRTPPEKPVIAAPAGDGAVYRTAKEELEIRGTAPRGTAGIIVNDYRLQLFQTGDTKWSYLASTRLNNFVRGENMFRIVAVSGTGYRSEPAILTIIFGEGEEGVVSTGTSSGGASSTPNPGTLPSNAPLKPGTLLITAPTAGIQHEAVLTGTGAEFLIEGNVPTGTASVWVNDYKLQLFAAGKSFFNYIASTSLNTLKRGTNTYDIITRDKDGTILDRTTYTIILKVE